MINHVTREDHGNYTCRAVNSLGDSSAKAQLIINIPHQESIDATLTNDLLNNVVSKAKENVEKYDI